MRARFVRCPLALALLSIAAVTAAHAQGLSSVEDFSLSSPAPSSGPETLDKIVAVVGNGVILESELQTAVNQVRARAGRRIDRMPRNVLRSQVLDHLILQRVQMQRAHQRGIEVSDADVQKGLARIAQQNNLSMPQFQRAVAANGTSMKQLRDQIHEQIMVSKLRQAEVTSKVVVTDNDVDRYLESQSLQGAPNSQYRIRHLLIPVAGDAGDAGVRDARRRIQALRDKIVNGDARFADVAAANSQGPQARNGGQMGWIDGASMPDLFADVLPGMSAGDISPVFRGADGFHLIKLEATRGSNGLANSGDRVMVDEVQARHILLTPNEIRGDERTRALARQIHARLAAGDDFGALARKYSDDSATSNQGGELDWVRPSNFDGTLQSRLKALDDGEISSVFHTPDGYEIVKVEDHRQRDQTREAMRNKARRALGEKKTEEEGELWLRKLRDEAYVDIRMDGYQQASDRSGG